MDLELYQKSEELLKTAVGSPDATFRDGQWEAIDAVLQKRKPVLLVQRTGWGKSYVYFILTRILRQAGHGPTVVISPLLALMRDQRRAASRLTLSAVTINSGNKDEWSEVENALVADDVDLLLVSPERFGNARFISRQLPRFRDRIGLLVIDEVHCISDWGHDFRPDYRLIGRMVRNLPPSTRILATTATANDRVIQDVRSQLGAETKVSRGTLNRESLHLDRVPLTTKQERMAWLAQHLPSISGSGIIYTLTVRDAEELSAWLSSRGIDAPAYHGSSENRPELEKSLHDNRVKALVATSALGMGFDKPDIEFVIHYQRPQSPVHYYQQVGRAGRNLPKALGIVFFGEEDDSIAEYFIDTAFPERDLVSAVIEALRSADNGLTQREIEREVNGRAARIDETLKILRTEDPPVIGKTENKWYAIPGRETIEWDRFSRVKHLRQIELKQMQEYLHTDSCLLGFLRNNLDDEAPDRCGRCSVCQSQPIVPYHVDRTLVFEADRFLTKRPRIIEPRKKAPYVPWLGIEKSTLPTELLPQPGRYLTNWGDGPVAREIQAGKYREERFSSTLIEAAANLIRNQWRPDPFPEIVVPVPSSRHVDLVPSLARSLAELLQIQYVQAVVAVGSRRPQKEMENSVHQARNVEHAFHVDESIETKLSGRVVLLVDDMVDSKWTITTISVLLKKSRCRIVYPFTLSNTASRV